MIQICNVIWGKSPISHTLFSLSFKDVTVVDPSDQCHLSSCWISQLLEPTQTCDWAALGPVPQSVNDILQMLRTPSGLGITEGPSVNSQNLDTQVKDSHCFFHPDGKSVIPRHYLILWTADFNSITITFSASVNHCKLISLWFKMWDSHKKALE